MLETIKQIRDFATATDNIYLLNKITLLEKQIKINIIEAKTRRYTYYYNQLNN